MNCFGRDPKDEACIAVQLREIAIELARLSNISTQVQGHQSFSELWHEYNKHEPVLLL